MDVFYTKIETDGKIQLPPQVLESLDFKVGQDLELELEKNALRVSLSVSERVKRAQARVRKYIPEGVSLVDELIEDRRREAEND
ncbi:MAG: AbrB/MazE/SpoVT family DNA-binding domain-containing protein [Acidobacteriota bacterium]|nr:AbrB/MazE/SpoVT family DNA-binding domain-containing protein [Acidobacteriota bacterium]